MRKKRRTPAPETPRTPSCHTCAWSPNSDTAFPCKPCLEDSFANLRAVFKGTEAQHQPLHWKLWTPKPKRMDRW